MNTHLFRRAEELFHRLVELAPEARAELLASECGDDAELRRELEELLDSDGAVADGFLDGPRAATPLSELQAGDRLGPYTILSRLGEGGMGLVYRARQDIPAREVALKVLRFERLSAGAARRFRLEAEILGNLQHPGIAQVFEGGTAQRTTSDGRVVVQPYLALELVRGAQLLAHADEHALGLSARLELLARVADAVHHAHMRGIIHRDLKPANVLVAEEEASAGEPSVARIGQPKVLDFGIARWAAPGVDGRHAHETRAGDMLGTLAYMSPEQLAGTPEAVDVRADVWALGVLLCELVTGRRPFELENLPLAEAVRRQSRGERRPLEELAPVLRGDLAVIVARALEPEPARRYQSAAELAADLRRCVAGEPILARADSALYLLQRRLERHRRSLVAALVACTAISALSLLLLNQVHRNRELAEREASARAHAEAELSSSNLERGRLYARTGHPLAEELLWSEFLRAPSSPATRWALWEHAFLGARLAARTTGVRNIRDVVFGPDDTWLAVGGEDGRVELFGAAELEPRGAHELSAGVLDLDVDPRDGRVVAACVDGIVRCFVAGSATAPTELRGHTGEVRSVAHHPREGWLLSAGQDRTLRRWERDGGGRILLQGSSGCWGSAFSPDGELCAVGGSGLVLVARAPFEAPLFELEQPGSVFAVAFAPDGRTLYSASSERAVRAFDVERGELLAERRLDNGQLYRMWIDAQGALDVLGDWRVDRLALPGLEPFARVGDPRVFWGAGSSSDGRRLASTTNSELFLWDVDPEGGVQAYGGHEGRAAAVLSPDGERTASGDSAGVVRVFDTADGRLLEEWPTHTERVRSLAVSPNGELLASGSSDGTLVVRALHDGEPRYVVHDFADVTRRSLAFSPDGELLLVTSGEPSFRLLRAADGTLVRVYPCNGSEALGVAFAPDGTWLATLARKPGGIEFWGLDGEPRGRLTREELGDSPWTLASSADGTKLALGTWAMTIQVWDVARRERELELEGHLGAVWDVAFVPGDDDLLVSVAADGKVKLWSRSLARNLATLDAFQGDAITLDVRPGPVLLVAGADPRVLRWDLTYWEQHLAANLDFELERFRPVLGASLDEPALRDWAAAIFARSRKR